ncbi:MAG: FG-GAP repeat protein [Ferruginibacter sp.]
MKKIIHLLSFMLLAFSVRAQNVGIGTTTPAAKLDIIGNIKITDGTQGTGKVLTSDVTGTATWQATTAASQTGGVGYGAWGDCSTRNISGFNPVAASDGTTNDQLGNSVSISGSYAIVGAYAKKVGANPYQGEAYIYYYNGTAWVQKSPLTASDGDVLDYFGYSVSINGNYAIVGAYGKTVGANGSQGKAYIYYYDGTTWVQQATLTAGDGAAQDQFGYSVSISGSYAIVGAVNKTVGANSAQGKIYIYHYTGTAWIQQAALTGSDGVANDIFGTSVSISGSYAIVGAINKTVGANIAQGKIYIYHYNGTTWLQQVALTAGDGAASDNFGYSVGISGSYAIVGAVAKTVGANTGQGKAYIYYYNGTTWVQQAGLTPDDGAAQDQFGYSVSINGNYAIVGADYKTVGVNTVQGASYIYINDGIRWGLLQKVTDPRGGPGNSFGTSVGIDGSRFLIGAPGVQNSTGMAFFGKVEQ